MSNNPLNTNPKIGLCASDVLASREKHGANVLTPPARTPLWKQYLEKYTDPMIRILLVAAVLSLGLSFVHGDFLETIGIFIAIFIATTAGFWFEVDAARKFDVLNAASEEQPVKVRRDGKVTLVPRKDIVVGDIVIIETGDEIPADGQLLQSVNLQVDESSLTGEPLASKREKREEGLGNRDESDTAFPKDMLLRSSMVMMGRGEMIVTAVGDATEIGKVARTASEETDVETPLNRQLGRLGKTISIFGGGLSALAFFAFLGHDIIVNQAFWSSGDWVAIAEQVLKYFMMAVTLIVMAVPEGLPMAITLSLALNMRRMLKSNNLVRKMHASETMGAVNIICTDKTGTLTQNRMRVGEMSALQPNASMSDAEAKQLLYNAIALNSTAYLDGDKPIGNPTEGALLLWLHDENQDYEQLRQSATIIKQEPFSTETKQMKTICMVDGTEHTFVKGAPEIVMQQCEMTDEELAAAKAVILGYQSHAMRTLALVCDNRLQAIFGISDPIRDDVPAAISDCHAAGIEVKVVTGDSEPTALEIARQAGIIHNKTDKKQSISGSAFSALDDEAAKQVAAEIKVMFRARPTDKQRLVRLLQQQDNVVAVTGDGTNDAPALNYAHAGLSLGSGTSVAKQASDITIIDDSFSSITKAVMWGRSLYRNIQRFLFFQLTVNVAALLLVLGGSVIGTEMPLTVTQILWINLIMDTFAAMALATLPPEHEVMNQRPRRQQDFILTRNIIRNILGWGLFFFVLMMGMLVYCERNGAEGIDIHELTIFFTTFVMLQFWNMFNAKALMSHSGAFSNLKDNTGLLLVMLVILIGQWLIVTFGGDMFRTVPLSALEWLVIIAGTAVVTVPRWKVKRPCDESHGTGGK